MVDNLKFVSDIRTIIGNSTLCCVCENFAHACAKSDLESYKARLIDMGAIFKTNLFRKRI
jgi:hypothetical protein